MNFKLSLPVFVRVPEFIHVLAFAFVFPLGNALAAQPNIVWFFVDDMSANFSCYGESLIQTPNVDRLAAEGTLFRRAYVTAPVCSTCRSACITGMYQTSIGAHHHRSGRGDLTIQLPSNVTPLPVLFQEAGYYTCIGSGLLDKDAQGRLHAETEGRNKSRKSAAARLGKTDYNFEWDAAMYDNNDWSGRAADQPFFMQVQLHGGKLREGTPEARAAFHQRVKQELGNTVDPALVALPPYYPREQALLDDWAAYLDSVRMTEQHVGKVLQRLQDEGLLDKSLIIFMTDHGISHARGKQFLYDEGTHIPFIVRGPGIEKGVVRNDLIEHIDMAAISLAAAGIPLPDAMQAQDVFSNSYQPREAVFAARDRCDETIDHLRSVRTEEFLYIRNFLPRRPHLQPNAYKDGKAIIQSLRASHAAGSLPAMTEALLFRPEREPEELYRYTEDRWQVKNLAGQPEYQEQLRAHRGRLDTWMQQTHDKGPESMAMYDSDMAVYLNKPNKAVKENIALMKQWASEGR